MPGQRLDAQREVLTARMAIEDLEFLAELRAEVLQDLVADFGFGGWP
jgi:hypothetical protein